MEHESKMEMDLFPPFAGRYRSPYSAALSAGTAVWKPFCGGHLVVILVGGDRADSGQCGVGVKDEPLVDPSSALDKQLSEDPSLQSKDPLPAP